MCALVLKRGRGRPRLNESREYNDSDLQLISEFKQRPALYNRNHPMYRDRENTDRLWQEMAILLSTPVSQIKERTTQLRNRYNIERRRLDMLPDQGADDPSAKTQWPLFEHLSFLSDHIKPRGRPVLQSRPASPNPPKRRKAQRTESSSEEEEQDNSGSLQHHSLANNSFNYYIDHGPDIERSFNGRSNFKNEEQQFNMPAETGNKREIYKAFGHFVSSSLIGMKEKDALRLLQKFTKELVHNMRQSPSSHFEVGDDQC